MEKAPDLAPLSGRNSAGSLIRRCLSSMHRPRARLYNRLVYYYPDQAAKVESDAYTRNVLGHRLASGDVRWLRAEGMVDWQPACAGWLVGWASSSFVLNSLIPFVEEVAARYPGSSWRDSIPGQLSMLDISGLTAMSSALMRLGNTAPDDPGMVEVLTALHLVVGWRDGTEISYEPARRVADQASGEPEFVLASHRWTTPRPEMNWQLLKLAVLGPEDLRLEAADAWADEWEWRNAVLLGLDMLPMGNLLRKSACCSYRHPGRAVAWARRCGRVDWFDEELSASLLLELESGPSAIVASMVGLCKERGWLSQLRDLSDQWLVLEARQRFKSLLNTFC